jgi:hypothetical protein
MGCAICLGVTRPSRAFERRDLSSRLSARPAQRHHKTDSRLAMLKFMHVAVEQRDFEPARGRRARDVTAAVRIASDLNQPSSVPIANASSFCSLGNDCEDKKSIVA